MILSNEVEFTFMGQQASMVVMRNSGHCWGRIFQGDSQFDVFIDDDVYDWDDEDAASEFIEAAKDPKKVTPRAA